MKKYWERLTAEQKKKTTKYTIIIVFVVVALCGYYFKNQDKLDIAPEVARNKDISLESRTMEDGLYETSQKQISLLRKELDDFKANPPITAILPPQNSTAGEGEPQKAKEISIPPPPTPANVLTPQINTQEKLFGIAAPPPPVEKEEIVGGIEIVKNQNPVVAQTEKQPDKKKDEIYLPPSYMEATLLSGLIAPTTTAGKNEPTPMILRVKHLAVLPNRVKANLKGCFVIAEGTGSLAEERIRARLVTLSCVAQNGTSVIDQPIKGFVVDADGRVGLRGRVVAKMGMHMARATFAAFVGGFGEALSTSSFITTTNSITGMPQQTLGGTDFSDVMTAGLGKGVAKSAKEIENFYLELAEQTVPVIEVGPTKTVTLVISEGVMLEIKEKAKPRKL